MHNENNLPIHEIMYVLVSMAMIDGSMHRSMVLERGEGSVQSRKTDQIWLESLGWVEIAVHFKPKRGFLGPKTGSPDFLDQP